MIPEIARITPLIKQVSREELIPRFAKVQPRIKKDGSIVTEADFTVQERLRAQLEQITPDIPLLSEEMSGQQQDALLETYANDGLWCLDPLDGTSNFASGIPFFCTSLALIIQRKPVLGIVYDPIRDECFTAVQGDAPRLNGQKLKSLASNEGLPLQDCIAVVDFKRLPPTLASRLAASAPYKSQRNFGSVALEWCWLTANRYQVYVHGRQKLWDYAAGAFIFSQTSGCAETLQGSPLFDPSLQTSSAMAAISSLTYKQWKAWLLNTDLNTDYEDSEH